MFGAVVANFRLGSILSTLEILHFLRIFRDFKQDTGSGTSLPSAKTGSPPTRVSTGCSQSWTLVSGLGQFLNLFHGV